MACLILFLDGLWQGLVVAPPDYQQGDVYRIIYLHVPLAIWSVGIYVVMTACSLIYFIWKIKNADIIVSCVGKQEIIRPEQIKKGVVLIGVGTHGEDLGLRDCLFVAG